MKKIILAVLLTFFIANYANAEWIIFHNGNNGEEYFYNSSKIKYEKPEKSEGQHVKVWCLVDSVGEDAKKYYVEISCGDSQYKLLSTADTWHNISPDSAIEKLEKKLCNKN